MPPLSAFVAVAAGAVLGAWLRWLLVGEFNGLHPHLPLGTLIANVGGGLVIGFAIAWLAANPQVHPDVRLFVVTGFSFAHSAAHLFGSLAAAAGGFAAYESL